MTVRDFTLTGERVRLRPVREPDIPWLTTAFNDPDVRYWLHHSDREDATEDDTREVFIPPAGDNSRLVLAIEAEDRRLIGVTRLIDIHHLHGRAELTIVIGDKSAWGRGYGTDAIRTLLRHAFKDLRLRRVELITDADNLRGIRSYEKGRFHPRRHPPQAPPPPRPAPRHDRYERPAGGVPLLATARVVEKKRSVILRGTRNSRASYS